MKNDGKSIDAMIKSIASRGVTIRTDSHECLVATLEHFEEHGDYTRLPRLIKVVENALGSSISAAMIDYVDRFYDGLKFDKKTAANPNGKGIEDNGFFVALKDVKKGFVEITAEMKIPFKSGKKDKVTTFFIGSAKNFPFYELERPATQAPPFDLTDAIKAILERAKKAYDKNLKEHAHHHVNSAQIEQLEKFITVIEHAEPEPDAKDEKPVTELVKKDAVKKTRAPRGTANNNKKTTANPALQVA